MGNWLTLSCSPGCKRILDLEFLEMSEVTVDTEPAQVPSCPPPPAQLPITDISQWMERYSLMAATLAPVVPGKGPRAIYIPGLHDLG